MARHSTRGEGRANAVGPALPWPCRPRLVAHGTKGHAGARGLAVAPYGFGYLASQPPFDTLRAPRACREAELTLHEHGCFARHPQPWSARGTKAASEGVAALPSHLRLYAGRLGAGEVYKGGGD